MREYESRQLSLANTASFAFESKACAPLSIILNVIEFFTVFFFKRDVITKDFSWLLMKVYGNLYIKMQNIIFPNFVFDQIILFASPRRFWRRYVVPYYIIQVDETLSESTYIIDVITIFPWFS